MRPTIIRVALRLSMLLPIAALPVAVLASGTDPHSPQGGGEILDSPAANVLTVRTSLRPMRFQVEQADAPASGAWCDARAWSDKTGAVPEARSVFELTRRVVVRTDDPRPLVAIASRNPELAVEPLAGVRGHWLVTTGSVREAAALAEELAQTGRFAEVYVDLTWPRVLRTVPTDPYFSEQWHLDNDRDPLFDVNAEEAWDAGYTGVGVVIGIVENAWQHNHPDLAANFNAEASQEGGEVTGHATSCAGIVAEVAYNGLMGAGTAYGAQISDQLFGSETEIAEALAYRNDLNDIKSNSWGPPDGGWIAYMPPVVRAAIEESIATGRDGLGEVFVWAAGNGGASHDRVDYDPYASSRYTIAVGAVGDADIRADYNERGSSLLVVAHSSGNDRQIHTTTNHSGWTRQFGGSSASCPLAAGVVALMLEANPDLTWRDVQHVLIESARKNDPNHPNWNTNGGGHEINFNYGFGAVDAGAAVRLAEGWDNVPHELVVDSGVISVGRAIPDHDPNGVTEMATISEDIRIETVELILNVQTTFVGDLEIIMTAPSGIRSVFARQRSVDGTDNYDDYVFTSVRHWGEQTAGDWTVYIADLAPVDLATWVDYRLIFYGTPVCPGDLDGDQQIGLQDVLALLSMYRACEGEPAFDPAADLNNNRCIDLGDLAYLLSVFGRSCP